MSATTRPDQQDLNRIGLLLDSRPIVRANYFIALPAPAALAAIGTVNALSFARPTRPPSLTTWSLPRLGTTLAVNWLWTPRPKPRPQQPRKLMREPLGRHPGWTSSKMSSHSQGTTANLPPSPISGGKRPATSAPATRWNCSTATSRHNAAIASRRCLTGRPRRQPLANKPVQPLQYRNPDTSRQNSRTRQ